MNVKAKNARFVDSIISRALETGRPGTNRAEGLYRACKTLFYVFIEIIAPDSQAGDLILLVRSLEKERVLDTSSTPTMGYTTAGAPCGAMVKLA